MERKGDREREGERETECACVNVCMHARGDIIIIIIAFKGAIRDFFLQSPHSAANCLQHCLKWPGRNRVQITCNKPSPYHVQVSCYVPLGMKGQRSYSV